MSDGSNRAERRARLEQRGKAGSMHATRIPPPVVPAISISGVAYHQEISGLVAGFDQMGGYLIAVDEMTHKELWALKVYDSRRDPKMEGDGQDVFFNWMRLQDDGTLLIENERYKQFVVDVDARTSTPVA